MSIAYFEVRLVGYIDLKLIIAIGDTLLLALILHLIPHDTLIDA